jgi:HSP20 family protein
MAEVEKHERELALPEWMSRAVPDWFRGRGMPSDWFDNEVMRLEELEEDGTWVVRAEMPGIDPDEDVEITVDKGALTIEARRRETKKEGSEESGSYRSEFRYGRFTRRLHLPAGATESDVKASYNDGILEVRVPIDQGAASARKIPVTRG